MTITANTEVEEEMDASVHDHIRRGWRIESRTERQIVFVKGHRPNHLLHFFLTLVTLGLWALIWICVTAFGGERRRVISF